MPRIVYLQFVGIDIVNAIFLLNILSEEGESTAKNSYLVSILLEHIHHAVNALGEGEVLRYFSHDTHIKPLEQLASLCEALLEIYLAAHGSLRNGCHLFVDTVLAGQLVNDLCLNKCGIHVEANQAPHTPVHIVNLERAVNLHLTRHAHDFSMQFLVVSGCASHRELYAGSCLFQGILYAGTAREAQNGVDIKLLVSYETADGLNLCGLKLAAKDCENVAVLTLAVDPILILFHCDGVETDVHTHLAGLEEEFFHNAARIALFHPDKYAERESGMDVRLSYILNVHIVSSQNLHDARCETWTVFARNAYKYQFFHGNACVREGVYVERHRPLVKDKE